MLLGDTCTRSCGFCAVKTGRPGAIDEQEPERDEQAGLPTALQVPGQADKGGDDKKRVRALQNPEDAVDQRLQDGGQAIEEARPVLERCVEMGGAYAQAAGGILKKLPPPKRKRRR